MKALTKPEKFRATSRIYGYECNDILENEDDVACLTGSEWIEVDRVWNPSTQEYESVYECEETSDPDINDC